ncbi:parathyroid hormone 4 [Scleropages formosus]|nr:parathyroid hormone 4-like [Scleropages formosus]
MAVMVLFMFASAQCQENERRAVTEHQLMHDRGRAMQSLKRLIWLSSAMEGLHTAHTRIPLEEVSVDCRGDGPQQSLDQVGRVGRAMKGEALQIMWNAFFRPHLTGLPAGEK